MYTPLKTSISMDMPEDVPIILDPFLPLPTLEPKENEDCDRDTSKHDYESNNWHGSNVYEEDCIVEETLLAESHKEIMHEVPSLSLELNICPTIL